MKEYIVKVTGRSNNLITSEYTVRVTDKAELWKNLEDTDVPTRLFDIFEAKQFIAEKVSKHVKENYEITVENYEITLEKLNNRNTKG